VKAYERRSSGENIANCLHFQVVHSVALLKGGMPVRMAPSHPWKLCAPRNGTRWADDADEVRLDCCEETTRDAARPSTTRGR